MAKSKLLNATALTAAALLLISCSKASSPVVEPVTEVDPAAVETLVVEAATRPGSELMAA